VLAPRHDTDPPAAAAADDDDDDDDADDEIARTVRLRPGK